MRGAATLLCAGLAAACGGPARPAATATVFAAASLSEVFAALAREFERQHPDAAIELHCAGTPRLVLQLREGARAGVFAAADADHMRRVVDAGLADGAPRTFAHNGLAVVVAAGNPKAIRGLADLARGDLRVALCGPDVPAGRYARAALDRAGVTVRSVSDEPSVRAVVAKVRLGELDAGVVYRTDVRGTGVGAVTVATEHDVVADYPIVALRGAAAPDVAAAFVAFVLSADGRRLLSEHGFALP